jgi:hypothetical protein
MRYTALALCALVFSFACNAQSPSPCSLATKAEVQEAAGTAVQDGTVNSTNKMVCDFKVGSMGSSVSILLTSKTAADSAAKTVAELKKRNIASELVPGLGDGAYSSSPGYGMQQIGAFKGARHVVVTVLILGGPEAKNKEVAIKVMRKALSRL